MNYEEKALKEALRWRRSLEKRSSLMQRQSKRVQAAVNNKIPDKVHNVVTESIRKMIETALTTSEYVRPLEVNPEWTLEEREQRLEEILKQYKQAAAFEGAGTGFGGFWLGLADFPLFLSIKMKFLFDAGQLYGFNVDSYEEKVFLLNVFMLAFSSDDARRSMKDVVLDWDQIPQSRKQIDWKTLQIEYRDTLDFVKLLQLFPGIGAAVGYIANGRLLQHLGETTKNASRLRLLNN